jgi:hypothetical protein
MAPSGEHSGLALTTDEQDEVHRATRVLGLDEPELQQREQRCLRGKGGKRRSFRGLPRAQRGGHAARLRRAGSKACRNGKQSRGRFNLGGSGHYYLGPCSGGGGSGHLLSAREEHYHYIDYHCEYIEGWAYRVDDNIRTGETTIHRAPALDHDAWQEWLRYWETESDSEWHLEVSEASYRGHWRQEQSEKEADANAAEDHLTNMATAKQRGLRVSWDMFVLTCPQFCQISPAPEGPALADLAGLVAEVAATVTSRVVEVMEATGCRHGIELSGSSTYTAIDLKRAIYEATGHPVHRQTIFCGGQEDELRGRTQLEQSMTCCFLLLGEQPQRSWCLEELSGTAAFPAFWWERYKGPAGFKVSR